MIRHLECPLHTSQTYLWKLSITLWLNQDQYIKLLSLLFRELSRKDFQITSSLYYHTQTLLQHTVIPSWIYCKILKWFHWGIDIYTYIDLHLECAVLGVECAYSEVTLYRSNAVISPTWVYSGNRERDFAWTVVPTNDLQILQTHVDISLKTFRKILIIMPYKPSRLRF